MYANITWSFKMYKISQALDWNQGSIPQNIQQTVVRHIVMSVYAQFILVDTLKTLYLTPFVQPCQLLWWYNAVFVSLTWTYPTILQLFIHYQDISWHSRFCVHQLTWVRSNILTIATIYIEDGEARSVFISSSFTSVNQTKIIVI